AALPRDPSRHTRQPRSARSSPKGMMSPEELATWDDLLHYICPLLRFTPKSGHQLSVSGCPLCALLLTQSGHGRVTLNFPHALFVRFRPFARIKNIERLARMVFLQELCRRIVWKDTNLAQKAVARIFQRVLHAGWQMMTSPAEYSSVPSSV